MVSRGHKETGVHRNEEERNVNRAMLNLKLHSGLALRRILDFESPVSAYNFREFSAADWTCDFPLELFDDYF